MRSFAADVAARFQLPNILAVKIDVRDVGQRLIRGAQIITISILKCKA
jgi:hypothetical protein